MSKMQGWSRQELRQAKKILKLLAGQDNLPILEDQYHLHATVGGPCEEGYTYTTYEISVLPVEMQVKGKLTFLYSQYTRSLDCDGRTKSHSEGYVWLRHKAKRNYWRNLQGHKGKFYSSRLVLESVKDSQRDYTAESMGY